MSALKELRERVAAGTATKYSTFNKYDTTWDAIRPNCRLASDAYHGSLDAAKALHEAVLTGWFWTLQPRMKIQFEHPQQQDGWIARVWHGGDGATAVSHDPARAWLLAILDALIAKEERTDG